MKLLDYDKKVFYSTPTGIKVGTKGKVQDPKEILQTLPKSVRRKLRKNAHKNELFHIASA